MSELIVGIDLGTTNSALAVPVDGTIKVINVHGQPTMPSCVGLDAAGKLLVGQAARNQLVAAPESTICSIKRQMGEELKVPLGNKQLSPEEISSFILRELKQEAERELGQAVRKAVVTVPAFFNERQRQATQTAGTLAGLEVVRIINEPTAAALAYGAGRTADETMLVYDLGGGTFDVSVVVVEEGVVEVKASHGDTHLGGDDFDQSLVALGVRTFREKHGVDISGNAAVLRRLKVVMERTKWCLSDAPFAVLREEYLDGHGHLEMEIVRADYESMIRPWLDKTLTCIHRSMEDARLAPKDLDKVMLVGGSTRTPLVHRLLAEGLRIEPRWEINPDLIVAMGAAVQAGIIAGQTRHSILVDISSHSFRTSSLCEANGAERLLAVPIITRNTPLPASKAEVFFTVHDNQDAVHVEVFQGEEPLPELNSPIGDFTVEGLSPVPAGSPIVIGFDLDLNGMLKVTATEKNTGLAKTVTMDTRGTEKLNVEAARRNIASLLQNNAGPGVEAGARATAVAVDHDELLGTAKDLRKRAETLLAQNLNGDDAAEIRELLKACTEDIQRRDWASLEARTETLSDLVFYLED